MASDSQRVLEAIRRIGRELRISGRAASVRVGLSSAQLLVLQRLAESGELSLGELSARTLTDPSSVSAVVARLVGSGLVTRKRSEEDERRVELGITTAGKALLRKAPAAAQERLVGAIEALGADRRKKLARLLEEVVEEIGSEESGGLAEREAAARRPAIAPARRARKG